ncbi:MAG: SIS domain-containing protein [Candidatus Limnocylindrales bacterium]
MGLRDEILEQPAAAERQLASSRDVIAALVARLRAEPVDSVVIAARGSSDHAAIYAQYLLGTVHRLPVALAAPSIVSLYGVVPRFARSLVVGISQSGASPDIVGVVEGGRRQNVPTLAITNDPASPLAAAAEYVIALDAGPERAIAATKTYTTSLLAIARLSAALRDEPDSLASVARVPAAIALALAVEPEVERIAGEMAEVDRCVVLGRGYEYATAREWALKLKELARVFADPYSSADFQHGPVALVEPGVPVLAVVPEGFASAGLVELLGHLRDRGADVLILSDSAAIRASGRRSVALPADVPEWLRPIVSIVPAQLFAYHLTRARGLDPEAPRNLTKVTRTR